MKYSSFSRALALVLAMVMVLAMVPATAFASDSAVYSQITSADELTTGKYVMVVSTGYAPTVLDGTWVQTEAVAAENGKITAPANLVWDITVNGETAKLTDSNGVTIAPKGGNNNGIKAADYEWKVEFVDGTFRFLGQGSDTVALASNTDSQYGNKFRGYKTSTVSGYPDSYPSYFTLYKLADGGSTEPSEPVETEPVTPAGPIADGDRVVIYAPAYGKALSTVKTGNYNVGVDVTLEGNVLTGYGDTEIFTVIDNGDGSFSFSYEGQNLGMADSYASMNLGAAHDDWTLTDLGDDLYNIITKAGFTAVVPQGAFYLWVKSPDENEYDFINSLKEEHILGVAGSAFKCPGYIRLSFCIANETIQRSAESFYKVGKKYFG
jgi:hypothetical protein